MLVKHRIAKTQNFKLSFNELNFYYILGIEYSDLFVFKIYIFGSINLL